MAADGPGKCEIDPREIARTHVFCDEWRRPPTPASCSTPSASTWSSASKYPARDVLAGWPPAARNGKEITTFDSTGLAIQDLALALAVWSRSGSWRTCWSYRSNPQG